MAYNRASPWPHRPRPPQYIAPGTVLLAYVNYFIILVFHAKSGAIPATGSSFSFQFTALSPIGRCIADAEFEKSSDNIHNDRKSATFMSETNMYCSTRAFVANNREFQIHHCFCNYSVYVVIKVTYALGDNFIFYNEANNYHTCMYDQSNEYG